MRAVRGLAFEDFRGARPAAAAAVAIAWCRAVEASVRLDSRHASECFEEPYALPPRKRARRNASDAQSRAAAEENAKKTEDYEDAPRARNRHRFQFLVDSALRVFVESVSRYGDAFVLDDDDASNSASGESVSWPAMRVSPLPGVDPRSLGGVDADADAAPTSAARATAAAAAPRRRTADGDARAHRDGGERRRAPARVGLYLHLSRFEDATFEALAAGIGWAIDPANRDFAFVRLGSDDARARRTTSSSGSRSSRRTSRARSRTTSRGPGTRRARAAVASRPRRARRGGPKRWAAAAGASGSRVGGVGFFRGGRSAVTGWLFAARGLTHKLLALALATFAWTVAE